MPRFQKDQVIYGVVGVPIRILSVGNSTYHMQNGRTGVETIQDISFVDSTYSTELPPKGWESEVTYVPSTENSGGYHYVIRVTDRGVDAQGNAIVEVADAWGDFPNTHRSLDVRKASERKYYVEKTKE